MSLSTAGDIQKKEQRSTGGESVSTAGDIQKKEQRSTGGVSMSRAEGCIEDGTAFYWR